MHLAAALRHCWNLTAPTEFLGIGLHLIFGWEQTPKLWKTVVSIRSNLTGAANGIEEIDAIVYDEF